MDRYRGEVPWAMGRADEMIGRLAAFADANPATSSGSRRAWARARRSRSRWKRSCTSTICRPSCTPSVRCPPTGWSVRPAMLPQRNVHVDGRYADAFEASLRS